MRQSFSEFIPEKLSFGVKIEISFSAKIDQNYNIAKKNFFYEETRISFINYSTPKGLTSILVKKNFEKIFRFGQDLGSKFSDRELQNGHFGFNGLRGLTSLLERITEEGLSCLEKKKILEISSRVGQDLGSKIGFFGNYRGRGS